MSRSGQVPAVRLRFPESPKGLPLHSVGPMLVDLNSLYELGALIALPGYEAAPYPRQLRLRQRSRLVERDQLRVDVLSYSSPLEITLWLLGGGGSYLAYRVMKHMMGLLDQGANTVERVVALPEKLRRLRLENDHLEQQVRGVELENHGRELDNHAKELELWERRIAAQVRLSSLSEPDTTPVAGRPPLTVSEASDPELAMPIEVSVRHIRQRLGPATLEVDGEDPDEAEPARPRS